MTREEGVSRWFKRMMNLPCLVDLEYASGLKHSSSILQTVSFDVKGIEYVAMALQIRGQHCVLVGCEI